MNKYTHIDINEMAIDNIFDFIHDITSVIYRLVYSNILYKIQYLMFVKTLNS